ncbi:MAG: aminotransferase class V-fold PLP-dependent enzyme [Clostridia bacterium]|nr:aminotransferase class V-fold PLP-dependent enzyme [Clostridia bacterium]MBR0277521.1 aminotransferase class V-fold PLP-dependent enzyme [Clostridia bacterium]
MKTLLEMLKKNKKIPMHMPGHKRNGKAFPYLRNFADIDITEIDGFDNLHNASGILKESMENAAKQRGADSCFYLVNGSTCGILAVICAVLKTGDKVIVARNCHKSVYNGIELSGAKPVFVYPEKDNKYGISGSINALEIEKKIKENPDAKLVILTSPTYEGVISDIEAICRISHKNNIPVLVDAAHGAHLGFGGFPKDALSLGADATVESLHKTLMSLTQTAVCYLSGKLIDETEVLKKLAVFETSSPSYILLSSIDGCINALKTRENKIFDAWENNLERFYNKISALENIKFLKNDAKEFFDLDKSKIVLFPKNKNGAFLSENLRKCGIEPEMTAPHYVICMTGAGDSPKNLKKLAKALIKIDKIIKSAPNPPKPAVSDPSGRVRILEDAEFCDIKNLCGRISAGYVFAYPPEVPILVPDEKITEETVKKICEYRKGGLSLLGDIDGDKILVMKIT